MNECKQYTESMFLESLFHYKYGSSYLNKNKIFLKTYVI